MTMEMMVVVLGCSPLELLFARAEKAMRRRRRSEKVIRIFVWICCYLILSRWTG